jgi:hypothetical protein
MMLPIATYALRRHVKRAIFGQGTLESTAFEREELCPGEQVEAPPAIHLLGQLERVIGTTPETSKEREIELMTVRNVSHAPTIAYHIRNAVLVDGSIYAGRLRYPLVDRASFTPEQGRAVHVQKAALASSLLGHRYFGHWLKDDCLTYLLAERFARPLCIRPSFPVIPHAADYQKYFGQDWNCTERAHIAHLTIFQDHGQNSLKRTRYVELDRRIMRRFGGANARASPLVYLRRGHTGVPRLAQNEPEIIEVLLRSGFRVVEIESRSLESIREDLASAKVVVSVEGSHISHWFAAPQKSALLVLEPADRFTAIHRGWTTCLGVKFGFVVGNRGESGYVFSSTEILRTLDLLMKEL